MSFGLLSDAGNLFILYGFLLATRFCGLLLLAPLIDATGYAFGFREFAVVTHAGLRGTTSIAFALVRI